MRRVKSANAAAFAAAALVFLTLPFILTFSKSLAADTVRGDVNGDGVVDFDDAYLVFNYVAGTSPLNSKQLAASDINGDGRVTAADAAQLFHFITGYLSVIPFSKEEFARLVILSYPEKTEYIEGDPLNLAGFVLAAEYKDGTARQITNFAYSGFSSTPGVKIVVIDAEISGARVKTAFTVTVYPAEIDELKILTHPQKLVYSPGEPLDLTGLVLAARVAGGRYVTVSDYLVEGYESLPGEQTVTLVYRKKRISFTVTVGTS